MLAAELLTEVSDVLVPERSAWFSIRRTTFPLRCKKGGCRHRQP